MPVTAPAKRRGGARAGAGRKPTGERPRLRVALPADLSERVRAVAGKPAKYVAQAVEAQLKRDAGPRPCDKCHAKTKRRLNGRPLCGFCGGE